MARILLLLMLPAVGFPAVHADDWPQWMGPMRNGVYRESGVVTQIPEQGLEVRWRQPIAGGYAGPAVADGRVFVADYVRRSGEPVNDPGARTELEGEERVICFDAGSGERIWQYAYDCRYAISYPAGPRCTPAVADGVVYSLGAEGDLLALRTDDGQLLWRRSLKRDFAAPVPTWGFASHPLVAGGFVYTMVGGEGQAVVAFDAKTGEQRWSALDAENAGYCPPSIIEAGGTQQLLVWTLTEIASLNPGTGDVYWTVPLESDFGMSICRPQREGNLLYASGIRNQSVLVELDAGKPAAKEIWRGDVRSGVNCANSTPIIEDGVIYGADCNIGSLMAVDTKDGTRLWQTFEPTTGGDRRTSHGTAFITHHEPSGAFLLFSETGDLVTARLSRDGYQETGRQRLLEPTHEAFGRSVVWSHPAYAGKTVYARNDKELVAVSLAEE